MKRTLTLSILFLFSVSGTFAQAPSQLQKPFSRVELLALLEAGQSRIELAVARRGIDFQPTEDYLNGVKAAGARDTLIENLRKAPAPATPASGTALSPGSSPGRGPANPDAVAREN